MRVVIFFVCLLIGGKVAAQDYNDLEDTYIRYRYHHDGGHIVQTLKLKGQTAGTYVITQDGGEVPDVTSGYWRRERIWRRREDSLQVLILDYENDHEAKYFAIERTGCLTPVYSNGDPIRPCRSFEPVKKYGWGR